MRRNENKILVWDPITGTNGLDPAGIHEVRNLVRDLPKRCGATVFLSSHLLAEVEQVATHLAIISQGQLKFEGTREELQMRGKRVIVAEVEEPARALALLVAAGRTVTCEANRVLIASDGKCGPAQINAMLVEAGVAVSYIATQRLTLEDFFLELTR